MLSLGYLLQKKFEHDFPEYQLRIQSKNFKGKVLTQKHPIFIRCIYQPSSTTIKDIVSIRFLIFTPIRLQAKGNYDCFCFHDLPRTFMYHVTNEWRFYRNETTMRLHNEAPSYVKEILNIFFPSDIGNLISQYFFFQESLDLQKNNLIVWYFQNDHWFRQIERSNFIWKSIDYLLDTFCILLTVDSHGKCQRSNFRKYFHYRIHLAENSNECPIHKFSDKEEFPAFTNYFPLFLTFKSIVARDDDLMQIKLEHFPENVNDAKIFDKYLIKRIKKGKIPCNLYFCLGDSHWGE